MRRVLDVLVPPRCPACAVPAEGWCPQCEASAASLRLGAGGAALLAPSVAAVGVYAYDGVVRDAVRGMKLSGRHAAAQHLGSEVLGLPSVPAAWPVTWVPSTSRRLRERGVELPQLLAGRPAIRLLRRRYTGPDQTDLTSEARRAFPLDAFTAVVEVPPDVVLVDDVRTTGATALAAATALLAGGARRVLVATLAVGGDDARQRTS